MFFVVFQSFVVLKSMGRWQWKHKIKKRMPFVWLERKVTYIMTIKMSQSVNVSSIVVKEFLISILVWFLNYSKLALKWNVKNWINGVKDEEGVLCKSCREKIEQRGGVCIHNIMKTSQNLKITGYGWI